MVSIPDWTRCRGMTGDQQKPTAPTSPSKLQRQRDDEAIKQAEEHGYFVNASRSFIKNKCLKSEVQEPKSKKASYLQNKASQEDLSSVNVISLPNARLRSLGDIGLCHNLRICILNNNYITRFEALASCTGLVKLDLHSNQINLLPGPSFWASLPRLCILNLHDNPIGQLENLHSLSACHCLMVATLHDTPLSLKRNYRHHVVNSIWSLKALDHHVISDEEIIEDADFGGCFSALHKAFKLKLCSSAVQI